MEYFVKGTFVDGTTRFVSMTEILDNDWHQFQDWECNAGQDLIFIDDKLDVWSCNGKNQYVGNLAKKDFSLLSNPIKCTRDRCVQKPQDIETKKQRKTNG